MSLTTIIDLTEISTDLTPTAEELIQSFKNLVINCSGDLETLGKFDQILSNEIDRLSSDSDVTDNEFVPVIKDFPNIPVNTSTEIEFTPDISKRHDVEDVRTEPLSLQDLVDVTYEYIPPLMLQDVKRELKNMFNESNRKYAWLSERQSTYSFGCRNLKSKDLKQSAHILKIMHKLNAELGLELDACLITHYRRPSDSITRHQDNEDIFDDSQPICNVSVGSLREIQFWDTGIECSGTLIKHIYMPEGSLVTMKVGCQQKLWHKVLEGGTGTRYCLSFRKLKETGEPRTPEILTANFFPPNNHSTPISTTTFPTSSIPVDPPPTPADVLFPPPHRTAPEALLPPTSPTSDTLLPPPTPADDPPTSLLSVVKSTLPPLPPTDVNAYPICPPGLATSSITRPKLQELNNGFPVHPQRKAKERNPTTNEPSKHLIIGDSMVKGLNVPDSIHICKGGIHPKQVLPLLPSSMDVLPPESYDNVRTVTLIVGTNALNVNNSSKTIPMLEVINDYEKLIVDLRVLFPNARIGLFNVLPRAYSTLETLRRIELFNSLFCEHVARIIPNVVWLKLYWDFVDTYGYLRSDLYGKDGIHLKFKGKKLMSHTITNFQQAYY